MESKKYTNFIAIAVALVLCLAYGYSTVLAQTKTLDRDLDPIIKAGDSFPLLDGAPINELFVFVYRVATDTWEPIPFQFDEQGTMEVDGQLETGFFFPDDGLLDADDELVFMAVDAGDRAATNWLDNPESQTNPRYEIEIIDPLDQSKKAWAYLYRSNTLTAAQSVTDYVNYIPGPSGKAAADTVVGQSYKMGNAENGLPNFLSISESVGGNGVNILSGQELRVVASDINFNEKDNFKNAGVQFIDGPVRVLREIKTDLVVKLLFGELTVFTVGIPVHYFGFSLNIQGDLEIPPDLPLGLVMTLLRQSFNLNQNASGMKFFSANNSDIPIDGSNDTIDDTVVFGPDINWLVFTGSQGTFVNLFKITPIGDTQKLFYQDDVSANSYGNAGIIVEGQDIEGFFPLGLTSFFTGPLPSGQESSFGSTLATTLLADQNAQLFDEVVPVELVSFTATVEKNDVLLIWITATETNNFGFDIERRVQSSEEWTKVAFKSGKGTTTVPARYEYQDRNLQPGTYEYRLKQIDTDGAFEYSGIVTAVISLPESFALHQNFPNPFNPSTTIHYQLPSRVGESQGKKRTILKIYNLLGAEVRTLVDQEQAPGFYQVSWDGKDRSGRQVSTGVYIYRLHSGDFVATKKMVFVQ
jgi:hypothetical protein